MNKISLGTSSIFPLSLETSFAIAHEAGYDGVEVMITNDPKTRNISCLKSLEEKYSISVTSFHAPVLLLTHFVWGTNPETKLQKTAELAANMGSDTVVVHPPFSWQNKYSLNFLKTVNKISLNTGVIIGVENMFPWGLRGKEMKAYSPSWEEIIQHFPKITFDFSHAALAGWDSLQVTKNLGDKLHHIHLCDGFGWNNQKDRKKVFDEHLPPGFGNQPVKETLNFLASQKWNGHIVSEINTRKFKGFTEKVEVLKNAADFARKAINSTSLSSIQNT